MKIDDDQTLGKKLLNGVPQSLVDGAGNSVAVNNNSQPSSSTANTAEMGSMQSKEFYANNGFKNRGQQNCVGAGNRDSITQNANQYHQPEFLSSFGHRPSTIDDFVNSGVVDIDALTEYQEFLHQVAEPAQNQPMFPIASLSRCGPSHLPTFNAATVGPAIYQHSMLPSHSFPTQTPNTRFGWYRTILGDRYGKADNTYQQNSRHAFDGASYEPYMNQNSLNNVAARQQLLDLYRQEEHEPYYPSPSCDIEYNEFDQRPGGGGRWLPLRRHPTSSETASRFGGLAPPTFLNSNRLSDGESTLPSYMNKFNRHKPYEVESRANRFRKILGGGPNGTRSALLLESKLNGSLPPPPIAKQIQPEAQHDPSPIPPKFAGGGSLSYKLDQLARRVYNVTSLVEPSSKKMETKDQKQQTSLIANQIHEAIKHRDGRFTSLSTPLSAFKPGKTSTPLFDIASTSEATSTLPAFETTPTVGKPKEFSIAAHKIQPPDTIHEEREGESLDSEQKPHETRTELEDFQDNLKSQRSFSANKMEVSWRRRKYDDDKELAQNNIQRAQIEVIERTRARANRRIMEEEDLRLRLRLEGLVLADRRQKLVILEEIYPALDEAANAIVKNAWNNALPGDEILTKGFDIDMHRRDLLTLSGLEWLNDEVVNFYMNLITERCQQDSSFPKVYAFNTFFFPRLLKNGYGSIKRWTKKIDVFSYDVLIIPVHLTAHWCLCTVDFADKRITYFDSLHGNNEQCLRAIEDYLCQESVDKKKTEFSFEGWEAECTKEIPKQLNGSDCGVFTCRFAECSARRQPPLFSQVHMPYFRQRMVVEICRKQLYPC